MTADAIGLGAVEQAALVRAGEISAPELVEASLRRIEDGNPSVCLRRAVRRARLRKPT